MPGRWRAAAVLVLITAGCTSSPSEPVAEPALLSDAAAVGELDEPIETDAPIERCDETELVGGELPDLSLGSTSVSLVELSQNTFVCSRSVVVVGSSHRELVPEAAEVAMALGGPLLLLDDEEVVRAELARLQPVNVQVFGDVPVDVLPEWAEVRRTRDGEPRDPVDVLRRLGSPQRVDSAETALVVTPKDAEVALAMLPAVSRHATTILILDVEEENDPDALLRFSGTVQALSKFTATGQWRIDLANSGAQLPGGGVEVFPGRRFVALYGSPVTRRLGVLGEQGIEESFARLQPLVAEYSTADDIVVVPSFEIIVTVADAVPGGDGDYSQELSVERVQPWVDYAAEHGIFVMLDLQPGRSDFLSQAKQYETLLREPHVGLALDPEWRLRPNEEPLTRIGSVSAAEVNEVVDWLAEIVREDALPQKPLIIHQFLRRMLPDREEIRTPPEVAVVIHVDGQGSFGGKLSTYQAMTTDDIGPDQQLWWGWKNFYDEDARLTSAEQVNEREPWPVVVTFQ